MSYKLGTREKNTIKIQFSVEQEAWINAIEKAYQKTKGKYKVEGFRPGHAPKKVIERLYGVQVFFEDALDIILPEEYYAAIEKENLIPVAQPDISIDAISDATLSFTAVVTLKPEFELGQYKGLNIKRKVEKVTKEEIDNKVKEAQDKASTWVEITDRACKIGDTVEIDYSGSIDGVKFEGGTAEKQPLELGAGQFIPGFEDQVAGMSIGEQKDITVKFPADYGHAELAGKDAVFAIKLHVIREKKSPVVDDEFAKDVSEFDTLKDYKEDIKKQLTKEKEEKALNKLEDEIVKTIAKNTKVDIPEAMIDEQVNRQIEDFESRMAQQGMKAEDYYKYTQTTREDVAKKYRDSAKEAVLMQLVFGKLFEVVEIKVTEKDIQKKIEELSKMYGFELGKDEESMKGIKPYIENELKTTKLMEYLVKENEDLSK